MLGGTLIFNDVMSATLTKEICRQSLNFFHGEANVSHGFDSIFPMVVAMIVVIRMLIIHAARSKARTMLTTFIARRKGISKRIVTSGKGNRKMSHLTCKTRVALVHPRAMQRLKS